MAGSTYIIAALIAAFPILTAAILTYLAAKRTTASNQNIARESQDLAVVKAQVETFQVLGESQARAIEQRDREIERLQNLVNFYRDRSTGAQGTS